MNAPHAPRPVSGSTSEVPAGLVVLAALIALAAAAWTLGTSGEAGLASTDASAQPLAADATRAGSGDETVVNAADSEPESEWISLFDGRTLEGWAITDFGGQGDVLVQDGQLVLEMGNDMTGVTATRPVPRVNYEVECEAMRVAGSDFFCGLTFPVRDDPCTLILGGWGGGVCGLSSIDGFDASENGTTRYVSFENGRWYHVRLRVTADRIMAWLDGEPLVDQELADRQISIRWEVEPSKPFGFSTWRTTGALRNIRLREMPPEEAAAE